MQKFPGVTEGICFGTAAFYVNKKLLVRFKEDGETLVVHTDERDKWMKENPAIFFITDHYLNYPSMLVRLAKVKDKDLQTLIATAWKKRANKRLLKEWEDGKSAKK